MGRHPSGYRPWRNAVSQLSLGPSGWVDVLAVVLAGAALLAFAAGLGYPPGVPAHQSLHGLVHGLAGTVASPPPPS